jgi:uncharacterized repeat protein (TIGR03803 family)
MAEPTASDRSSKSSRGATDGGLSNVGSLFELPLGGTVTTTLASFNGPNGAYPSGGLIMDPQGNLYGTTTYGGANMDGTVWEFQFGSVPEPSTLVMGFLSMVLVGGIVLMKVQRLA